MILGSGLLQCVPPRLCRGLLFPLGLLLTFSIRAETSSIEFTMSASQGRPVPVLATYPSHRETAKALIVFSHGAFAAPGRYKRLFDAWAEAGYVVVAPRHVDSELNPHREDYSQAQTTQTRLEEFGLLCSGGKALAALSAADIPIANTVIAAGHSYGALIAQVAGGAKLVGTAPLPEAMLTAQSRLAAIVALSPPGPFPGLIDREGWSHVTQPMLVVTGTTDVLPGFADDWRTHLVSFEAAETAPSYALIFANQDHYFNGAFGRPRESLTVADVSALDVLNTKISQFIDARLAEHLPDRAAWESMSDGIAEARASAATER
jgi:dienelactone hydrolase